MLFTSVHVIAPVHIRIIPTTGHDQSLILIISHYWYMHLCCPIEINDHVAFRIRHRYQNIYCMKVAMSIATLWCNRWWEKSYEKLDVRIGRRGQLMERGVHLACKAARGGAPLPERHILKGTSLQVSILEHHIGPWMWKEQKWQERE